MKPLEILNHLLETYIDEENYDYVAYIEIEKSLKALEIIKKLPKEEKQVLLNIVYTYTKSEEEYDLLKKVLL